MGESKRRKNLDPNYGSSQAVINPKYHSGIQSAINYIQETVANHPPVSSSKFFITINNTDSRDVDYGFTDDQITALRLWAESNKQWLNHFDISICVLPIQYARSPLSDKAGWTHHVFIYVSRSFIAMQKPSELADFLATA